MRFNPCIMLVLIAFAMVAPVYAADVVLRERVAPTGAVLRLGEIGSVVNASQAQIQRLEALPLMPAPAPGTQQVIRAQEIRDLLVAHGVELGDVRFAGASTITIGASLNRNETNLPPESLSPQAPPLVSKPPRQQSGYRLVTQATGRVKRSPRTVTGAEVTTLKEGLQKSITAYIQAQTGDELLYSVGLDLLSRNATSLAQATGQVEVSTTSPIAIGRQRFLVSFTTPAGPVRFPVFSEVQQATPVVVAVRTISRGATITAADVRLQPLAEDDRPRGDVALMLSVEEVIGREAGNLVRPGQPLTDVNSLPPMMVRRGDLVEVTAGGGGVTVRRIFKARRDGRLGQMVEVESPDDEQRLSARVVGHRELAVVSAGSGAGGYLSPSQLSNGPSRRRIR